MPPAACCILYPLSTRDAYEQPCMLPCRWSAKTNKLEHSLRPPAGADSIRIYDISMATDQPGIAFVLGALAYNGSDVRREAPAAAARKMAA